MHSDYVLGLSYAMNASSSASRMYMEEEGKFGSVEAREREMNERRIGLENFISDKFLGKEVGVK